MSTVTLEIKEGGPDSTPTIYTEDDDAFAISAGQPPSSNGQTPNGLTIATDVGRTYMVPTFSNAEIFVESTAGKTFGLLSIDVDGFKSEQIPGNGIRSESASVTFTFIGINPNLIGDPRIFFEFTTNDTSDFELLSVDAADPRYRLPEGFRSGLVEISWTVTGGTNVWGAFDNLVLSSNTAPVATGLEAPPTTEADGTVIGEVGGQDDDGDALTYQQDGLVAGVSVFSDGRFEIERTAADDDLLPGQFRTVTFAYTVTDGFETSAAQSVSVNVYALPQGADIRGGNRPQTLCGTEAGERIFGGNQHDTLCGAGGADTLSGDNGNDVLDGGNGRDKLLGGNGSDTMDGGAGNDVLDGGNSPDRLTGGFGDDTMTGGNSPDEFYLGPNWGHDVITDFDPKNEHIHLVPSPTLGSWFDLQHSMTQVGANVLIDDHTGNTLLLMNVKMSSLRADDFLFG